MAAARILVVLGVLLVVLSLLAGYIRFQGLDTRNGSSRPLSELIADERSATRSPPTLVDALYANVDVQAALEERLPPDQQGWRGRWRRSARAFRPGRRPDARASARPGACG